MNALQEKILKDGKVLPGHVLKVSNFLNHQLDVELLMEMGREIASRFADAGINKILTIEASGIAIATVAAVHMHVPVLYAKKSVSNNLSNDRYVTEVFSYTHQQTYSVMVDRAFLTAQDRVLIVDDFLARGNAMVGLIDLVGQAGAQLCGVCSAIEKGYQGGGDSLRARGIRVESLAIVEELSERGIRFR